MRADRLLAILLRLHSRGKLKAQDLATELEVSRRTIIRDIAALSIAGIPVYAEGGHGGGIHLDPAYRVNLTGLSEPEAAALMRSFKRLPLDDHAHQQAAELGLLKVLAALPAQQRHAVQRVQERVHLDPNSWWSERVAPPSLDVIEKAVFAERRLRIDYKHHDGTITTSVIEPYGLVDKASRWYLVAQRDGEWRTYRVERLHMVELLDETFARPESFDLATHWQVACERFETDFPMFACTLRVARDSMAVLEKYAAGRFQVIADADPTWLLVALRLRSSHEASMLIWGLGEHVRIMSPQTLREDIAARAKQVLDVYDAALSRP